MSDLISAREPVFRFPKWLTVERKLIDQSRSTQTATSPFVLKRADLAPIRFRYWTTDQGYPPDSWLTRAKGLG